MFNEIPRCRHCGEVIGVYEPMIVLDGGQARKTSRAVEAATGPFGECYHQECFTGPRGEASAGVGPVERTGEQGFDQPPLSAPVSIRPRSSA